mmetsp:Transcript_80610/g.213994  ORF Transcript_80610/g.213994 Transcript_80610/m.213994 type:complete len:252 (-) Transcript_80610:290-1045(-)
MERSRRLQPGRGGALQAAKPGGAALPLAQGLPLSKLRALLLQEPPRLPGLLVGPRGLLAPGVLMEAALLVVVEAALLVVLPGAPGSGGDLPDLGFVGERGQAALLPEACHGLVQLTFVEVHQHPHLHLHVGPAQLFQAPHVLHVYAQPRNRDSAVDGVRGAHLQGADVGLGRGRGLLHELQLPRAPPELAEGVSVPRESLDQGGAVLVEADVLQLLAIVAGRAARLEDLEVPDDGVGEDGQEVRVAGDPEV